MNLKQLILKNVTAKRDYRVENSEDSATIYLYDVLDDYYGISSQQFAKDLTDAAKNSKQINLRVNSPGGDVFAGRAMATAIKSVNVPVNVCVDGCAASAATTVVMACENRVMAEGTLFMIHNAWTLAIGDKAELLKQAALLDKVDGLIAADYMNKTGKPLDQVVQWMNDETWFTPQEALDAGFITALDDNKQSAQNRWDLTAYKNAPKTKNTPIVEDLMPNYDLMNKRLKLLEMI